jgi:SAM-dependent methyltransferase
MGISARATTTVNWILENLVPPVMRDPLVKLGIKIIMKEDAPLFLSFKQKAPLMTPDDFMEAYKSLRRDVLARETDLNKQSIDMILKNAVGERVLDIACGKGYLTKRLAENGFRATGVDFEISRGLIDRPRLEFVKGDLYEIPFGDKSFDTVICAHTLEHVLDMEKAVAELRRVCGKRLMIVVPRQREYRYGFNLHINFFPYPFSLMRLMRNEGGHCVPAGLDLFYYEDVGDE